MAAITRWRDTKDWKDTELNNTHKTKQKWTNNGFRNPKKYSAQTFFRLHGDTETGSKSATLTAESFFRLLDYSRKTRHESCKIFVEHGQHVARIQFQLQA